MFVRANNFDYDKLLEGIVTHLDLQDTPLDDTLVNKVLKDFEFTYKKLYAEQKLEKWQEAVVIELLTSVQLTSSYIGMDYGECLDKVLTSMTDILTGGDDGVLWNLIENFYDRLIYGIEGGTQLYPGDHVILGNGAKLDLEQFSNFLRDWTESHLSNQLEGINGFLFDIINNYILPREYMTDISILEVPGIKVKYGDTLITFPIILLEVHNR